VKAAPGSETLVSPSFSVRYRGRSLVLVRSLDWSIGSHILDSSEDASLTTSLASLNPRGSGFAEGPPCDPWAVESEGMLVVGEARGDHVRRSVGPSLRGALHPQLSASRMRRSLPRASVTNMSAEDPGTANLLSDDPRDGSAGRPDELDRKGFAAYLGRLVVNVSEQSESSVLALIGDWGSGKTSILELLRSELTVDKSQWLVADFNPWTYADAASLQRGFFAELIGALPENNRPSGARAKIGQLARTVSPIGKLGGVVGADMEGVIRGLGDLIAGDGSASAAKRAAETALRRLGRPVLMVIDDLDRLTPDELLEVLKLVRLVGRLPYVYYMLAYDERTLLDVLRRSALTGDDEGRARAYLEKIVQVRLDMPVLRESQRTKLFQHGLNSILSRNLMSLSEVDDRRLAEAYFSVLALRLNTPRAITRFLGQVQAFFPSLQGEVDFIDFFLISWLRTQEPGAYAMLQQERNLLLGRTDGPWDSGRRDLAAVKARQQFWQSKLEAAHVQQAHLDGVIRVLSGLFPEIDAAFAKH
jgi:hypothetical protein